MMTKTSVNKWWLTGLFDLFYPKNCVSCGTHLIGEEIEICKNCLTRLPRTKFEINPTDNAMCSLLWGRCKIECAFALFFYRKGERVQKLLHEIKYKGNKNLGVTLGKQLAQTILDSETTFDYIIPIPLHHKKYSQRGFNQSEVIAEGMSQKLGIPLNLTAIYRNVYTNTQTRKGRFERWQNVESIFSLNQYEDLANKHVLVIDDVITTGSTIEACVNTLSHIENIKISIASIACAAL